MKALSLFSNCGAGDVGFRKAGFDFRILAELNPNRLAVALANHPSAIGVPGDLRLTWSTVVEKWRAVEGNARPDLLAACPPCQGMSSARSGLGLHNDHYAGGRDPRNLLVTVIESVARELRPRVIVVENVPAFLTRAVPHPKHGGPISAALLLINALDDAYQPFTMTADLADWGVPQRRKRSFITFVSRDESGLEGRTEQTVYPLPTHAPDQGGKHVTIRDFLLSLDARTLDARNEEMAIDRSNPLHFVPIWSDRQYRMVEAIPPYSGDSAWHNQACSSCPVHSRDADAATCSVCGSPLLRPVVKEGDSWRLVRGFRTSSYSRMMPDSPAATITTASGHVGSDKTIHPWEIRVLSPYECAQIQTFPDDFVWGDALEQWGHTNIRAMIGEAVPPRFTELHGHAIKAFLGGTTDIALMSMSDVRIRKAELQLKRARAQSTSKRDYEAET